MTRLVLYTRVSTQEQGTSRNGLEAQLEAMQRFAQAGGHEVVAHYEEVASGGLGMDRRPVLRAAREHAQRAGATLLVAKLDRLSRSVEFIAWLMNTGTPFTTVEDGLSCSAFQLHIKAALAEQERKLIGERTKAALGALKARGVPLGIASHADPSVSGVKARAAAAASVSREADSFASHVAPMLRRMRGAGMPLAAIAQELNTQGIKTARGGVWHASTVCNIFKRLDRMA